MRLPRRMLTHPHLTKARKGLCNDEYAQWPQPISYRKLNEATGDLRNLNQEVASVNNY